MYKDYIGKILTHDEMFHTFVDNWIVSIPWGRKPHETGNKDSKSKIAYVGKSRETAEALIKKYKTEDKCELFRGKISPKNGNTITMEELAGIWYASVDYGEGAPIFDYAIVFFPNGKAKFFYSFRCIRDGSMKLDWFADDNVIVIESGDCFVSYRGLFNHASQTIDELDQINLANKYELIRLPPQFSKNFTPLSSPSPEMDSMALKMFNLSVEWGLETEEVRLARQEAYERYVRETGKEPDSDFFAAVNKRIKEEMGSKMYVYCE